jgi:hypothetical protein
VTVIVPRRPGETWEQARVRLEREDPLARSEATQEVLRQVAAEAAKARSGTKVRD